MAEEAAAARQSVALGDAASVVKGRLTALDPVSFLPAGSWPVASCQVTLLHNRSVKATAVLKYSSK
jgi:hypothetical protein